MQQVRNLPLGRLSRSGAWEVIPVILFLMPLRYHPPPPKGEPWPILSD